MPQDSSKGLKVRTAAVCESDRRPSSAELEWEEKTLRPGLKNSPERPTKFTTVSSYPIERLYTEADLPDWDPGATSATQASLRTRAAFTLRCIAGVCGRCASSPGSARPKTQIAAFTICFRKAKQDFLSRSICPH